MEFQHAQTYHREDHVESHGGGAHLKSHPLTYDEPKGFKLRAKMFSYGDATIGGPDGRPWFQLQRLSSLAHFGGSQWGICNMRGDLLVVMQECYQFASRKYRIYAHSDRSKDVFALCSIKRVRVFIEIVLRQVVSSVAGTGADAQAHVEGHPI